MSRYLLFVLLLLATGVVLADEVPKAERDAAAAKIQTQGKDGAKLVSGMSILGNQEAPKSLVIVPWKSSGIGKSLGISAMLDDSRQPVDKEVFMRALSYYEIRSESTPRTGAESRGFDYRKHSRGQ
jgi:hypothetical protein